VERKGAGHPRRDLVNGQPEEPTVSPESGSFPRVVRARMNREVHVRIREGLGVQFPGPTRRTRQTGIPTPIDSYLLVPLFS